MLRAQIDNDRDWFGGSGTPEVTFRPLSFVEHRTFAKRSHVKHRKVFDMTYIGSTRVVDQASAHSLPLTVAGRHIALGGAGYAGRTTAGDGEAAFGHAAGGQPDAAGVGRLLRQPDHRAEGTLQHTAAGRGTVSGTPLYC